MKLQKKDISVFKINWKEKYTNIREIAKELNLALNSFVFWDDNPIEREKIKINLPEVRVIDVPNEIYNWIDLIKNDETFAKPIITSEDKKKTKQYQSAAKFNEDKKNKGNDNFLKNILLKPRIFKPNKSNITRFSQMTIKTNHYIDIGNTIKELIQAVQNQEEVAKRYLEKYGDLVIRQIEKGKL